MVASAARIKGRTASRDVPTTETLAPEPESTPVGTSTLRKLGGVLREVPCTFEDVAWSADLKDRDRVYLGALLRFLTKCAGPVESNTHAAVLAENAETSFAAFVAANYPLPAFTVAGLHALTLLPTAPDATPMRLAVPALVRHLLSVGRIPDIRSAAALTIQYGASAELCQVWSRGAAVAGALNVLERGIEAMDEVRGKKLAVHLTDDETVTADWLITAPIDGDPTTPIAKGIYLIPHPLPLLFEKRSTADRIAPGAAVLNFPAGSLALTLEGKELLSEYPVYIIAHSSATEECGKDESESSNELRKKGMC